MQLDRRIHAKGEEWVDFHVIDTPHNCMTMCSLLTSLACFVQLTSNLANLSVMSRLLTVTNPIQQPAESDLALQPAGGDAERTQVTSFEIDDTAEDGKMSFNIILLVPNQL